MSSNTSPGGSTTTIALPMAIRSRRGSLVSLSGSSQVDKEQLAQALDAIHNTASQSETLTTFNEFASPPNYSSGVETKGVAGELIQNGLSGLYSRFRDAVGGGKDKTSTWQNKDDTEGKDITLSRTRKTGTTNFKLSTSSITRDTSGLSNSPIHLSSASSRIQSPITSSFTGTSDSQQQSLKSSKAPSISTPATSKSSVSNRPIPPLTKATVSSTIAPVTVNAFKDRVTRADVTEMSDADTASFGQDFSKHERARSGNNLRHREHADQLTVDHTYAPDSDMAHGNSDEVTWNLSNASISALKQENLGLTSVDGVIENRIKSTNTSRFIPSALSSLQAAEVISQANTTGPSRKVIVAEPKHPSAIDRIPQSHLPGYYPSRASSTDRSTAEVSPVHTSAHISTRHDNLSVDEGTLRLPDGKHFSGTTANEGDLSVVSARLEQMRKQVLSKEFWMADEICKECFLCGDAFTAFRRKHHCRTCGCIFDSKCTSIISGERFGVQGNLRVCKTCLDIINRRHDSSGSDDSADDAVLPTSFFQSQQARMDTQSLDQMEWIRGEGVDSFMQTDEDHTRPLATPMMAIPATRRVGESSNRRSAVLEIDVPQLSRPGSSRSLKSLSTSRPPSSSHRRHQSRHNFLGRFRATAENHAPFHGHIGDEMEKRSRLPTFHDDNIIDPDLAPYMSDEGSSGDEQMSIFAALNSNGLTSASMENERSGFGSLLSTTKKHRSRAGDKSISGVSFTSRGIDEGSAGGSIVGHTRPNRRRNLSAASNNLYHGRGSPRQGKLGNIIKGFGNLSEEVGGSIDAAFEASPITQGSSKLTRSASMRDTKAPIIELNNASLHHVRRLLRQLLQDANVPNMSSWEKALVPILLQCTDDVNPDVRRGDDIDIRHYVKLKKVSGGKPGDTSYVSGVVFTKNLALKSMPRSIPYPRIVIVSFPIEYQRRQQHFMSLEPVIAQEKEFLRNMINRIASLRPQVLLVQSHVSGLALQYLVEAKIAVVYNVKQSVIEAVSRCAQTEIISSIDMVALKPVHIGKSASFDVKTYVHNDIPEKKKTCIHISGCPKDLGCTIVLRGASMPILSKMKRITEFMVYVVYNLKLETCLMRDEFVLIPSVADNSGSLSPSKQQVSQGIICVSSEPDPPRDAVAAASDKLQAVLEATENLHEKHNFGQDQINANQIIVTADKNMKVETSLVESLKSSAASLPELPKLVSAHESHVHGSHEDTVPEDIPMPTFYSDMVAKHQTKILSASPFVKFTQPYLLVRAREQERRLVFLKRRRDQDTYEEQTDNERARPQRFQLIQPEMVQETVKEAPRQIMEVLHAVHDAEYDKALHNYQTQKRQWENYIQGNLNLFDPYAHQNIVVLYTVVCTSTTVPCAGPDLLALAFYNEHESSHDFDPDCTLGQYVEDLCLSADTICTSNGCERKMSEHHRTYVHGEARITVFLEKSPSKIKGLQDSILMWSYCKVCKKETQVMPMSESTWKYSFGKYLELSFWSSELRLRAGICPHDLHRDHLRYFGYRNVAIRIHYDPIDLLEIVVPRTRITWKVNNDLRLKNDLFTKTEDRWNRFMLSVKSRIKGINIDSVVPEKVEACKAEVEKLTKRAQEEHTTLLRKLQEKYMDSRYYEVIPLNRAIRAMQEKVAEWDTAFADFDANFFPSEKDIRRLAALQLRKMFMDRDASVTSFGSTENGDPFTDTDEKSPNTSIELTPHPSDVSASEFKDVLRSVVEEENASNEMPLDCQGLESTRSANESVFTEDLAREVIQPLDLALPVQDKENNTLEKQSPSLLEYQQLNPTSLGNSLSSFERSSTSTQSSSDSTISEHVQQLRQGSQIHISDTGEFSDASGIPRPSERGFSRRSGMIVSPSMSRTQSQPTAALHRLPSSSNKSFISRKDIRRVASDAVDELVEPLKPSLVEPVKDKKLSERLGLGTLKTHRKAGHSLIPRSIQGKKKESKVSTLAKHFEQLSREFEKERLRDRKQRAARVTQSRAFPKASSKPIVEIYKDVDEAVEEPGPSDDDLHAFETSHDNTNNPAAAKEMTSPVTNSKEGSTESHLHSTTVADETATEVETDDNQPSISQTASDEEGVGSDVEHSLLADIPGVKEIAESLDVTESSTDIDLPKHEKSSLMKMLTNFWAERSASGWTQLEYPLNATDHVFMDSDVVVREDEPSSLIAFALSSRDYIAKLDMIRRQGRSGEGSDVEKQGGISVDISAASLEESEVETSLLRATGTHLKYQFVEGSAKMLCKIFYAEQFDAVRRKCGVADRIVESLSRCLKWDSKGGKTKSVFLKTLDDRLVLKSLSPVETQAFLRFAPAYFNIMAEALFHELPTVIAKMLGFYQLVIKNPVTGTEIKWDVLVMENLFYDRSNMRIFDLKGSMRNRKIQSTGEENEVLLDENMVEFIYESPLFAREHSKKLLRASVWNDTLFLARQNVMDYSLMVAVDEARKELVVGIIDCIRTYTWDKKLESWIKDRGFAGGGRNRPTVTSPKEYKSRFREAMARYVLQAPNCWHQFSSQQGEMNAITMDPNKDHKEGNRNETVTDIDP